VKKLKKLKKKLTKRLRRTDCERIAAIDIGSNAIRMILAEQGPQGLHTLKKFRFPIRLGADVFATGRISGKNLRESARTFKKFRELAKELKVTHLRAVGTSALRESQNGKAFVELIRRKSGIRIEIIDGVEEAKLIHTAVRREVNLENNNALLIDIGGGSVELTFSEKSLMSATQSFPFGTVRTLERLKKSKWTEAQLGLVIGEYLNTLSHFIHSHASTLKFDFAIGTGGNLETLGKLKPMLLGSQQVTSITATELTEMVGKIARFSIADRIEKLKLRPDRADVILPAALVVQAILRQANIERLLIPHVGLKDGLLWSVAQRVRF
jgi:exopolyphosphatase/guanosine-5'-triphosphate,3'-diphosphate pyrophosphatase